MRVFIAFDLSIRTVENLVVLQEDLAKPVADAGAKARWTDAANIHLTLKFLGEMERGMVFRVRDVLRLVSRRHVMFDMETVGVGCFPKPTVPRIIWAGTGPGQDHITQLQSSVEAAMAELGIEPERRPFHPHVTIGRIKTRTKRIDLGPVLEPYAETFFGVSQIKELILFQSELKPTGAVYSVIERFPLSM